jgi:hypothetical protein
MKGYLSSIALIVVGSNILYAEEMPLITVLRHKVDEQQLVAANPMQALFRLSAEYQVPMGIIWTDSPNYNNPLRIDIHGLTVEEAIQRVIYFMPGEQVTLAGEVLHISSEETNSRVPWLAMRFHEYIVDDQYVSMANYYLRRDIEVRLIEEGTRPQKSPLSGCAGHVTLGQGDRQISIHLKEASVEQILDSFVQSSGLKIWVVTLPNTTQNHNAYETKSLFSSASVPEQYQPYWELLAWGVDPKSGGYRPEWVKSKGKDGH